MTGSTNGRGSDGREGTKLKRRETHCVHPEPNHAYPSPKPPANSPFPSSFPPFNYLPHPLTLASQAHCAAPHHRVHPCAHNGVEKVVASGMHAQNGDPWLNGTAIKSGGIFVGHIIVVGGVSGSVGIDSWWRGQRCGVVNGR